MNFFFTYPGQTLPNSQKSKMYISGRLAPSSLTPPPPIHEQIKREMREPNPFSEIDRKKTLAISTIHPRNIMRQFALAIPASQCGACSKK